jgi:hypothetical protein
MIADEDRVEPDVFRNAGKIQQFIRAELFRRCLVSELEQLIPRRGLA